MNRIIIAIALAAGCGSHPAEVKPVTPPAGADVGVKQEVQTAYAGYATACEHDDIAGVMGFLTPDVEWRLNDGKVEHRAEIEPDMTKFLASIPAGAKVFFTFDEIEVESPERAVADVVFHLEADVPDAAAPGGVKKIDSRSGWHDTWVKTAAGWQNQVGVQKPDQP